jgi:aldehyde:ferredoxin oxidoreductase
MASNIPGYHGQLLDIDLAAKTVKTIDLDPKLAHDYLGGRALGTRLLVDAYGANWGKIDPLGPDALLMVTAGPYVGFIGCKTNFVIKSPLSRGVAAGQASGDFAHELRFCGYDGVIIRNKAASPTYLTIFDNKVEFRDASKIWGKEIRETHEFITQEHGDRTSQFYIGPAGENLCLIAAAVTEWYRAAARGGHGAVMGSKNLKAIVCRGTGPAPQVADHKKLLELMAWARKNQPLLRRSSIEFGTTSGIYRTGTTSTEPVRNWQSEWHDNMAVSGEMFAANQWVRRYWADYGCLVSCSKLGRIKYGKRAGYVTELPDYEAGALEGTNFGIFDIDEMAVCCGRPDELGFDLISLGNVCGFACEAQEKGMISAADLGGLELKWGDADGFLKLMDLIAHRKGEIPTALGDGLEIASKKIGKGSEAIAMVTKGIEFGAHGIRAGGRPGEGSGRGRPLAYAVSSQGGDHTSTASMTGESAAFGDSLPMCSFQGLNRDQQLEWLQAITGFGITTAEVDKAFLPRCMTMNRITLLLGGRTYKDDVNPPRAYTPLPEGPQKGGRVYKEDEEPQKQQYYAAMGWDKEGVPTAATLQTHGFAAFESAIAPLRAKA